MLALRAGGDGYSMNEEGTANNRKIAELMGWTIQESVEGLEKFGPFWKSPSGDLDVNAPDFYEDEELSAMLLEAMPSASLQYWSDGWRCTASIQHFGGESIIGHDADRKSAICAAFIAWKLEAK